MNGRSILFNRLLIGFLAYFFCGLAHASKIYTLNIDGSSGPDPYSLAANYLKGTDFNLNLSMTYNNCPGAVSACALNIRAYAKNPQTGDPYMPTERSFTFSITNIICGDKKDKPAGDFYIPIPGAYINSQHEAVLTNKDSVVGYARSGFPSCDGTCRMVKNKNAPGSNQPYYRDDSTAVLVLISMVYNGEECTGTDDTKKPPVSTTTGTPPKPAPKKPDSQADCPPRTTFGEVNGVKMCAKNAPLPTDPNPPPKPGDKDSCVGNCDKWDPNKDGKDPKDPTDPTKPKDPTTPGGSTSAPKGPLNSDASKPASENASGPGDSTLAASCTDFKCKNKDPATCEIARLAWNNKCNEEKALKDLTESELYKGGNTAMSSEGLDDMKTKLNFNGEGNFDMEGTIKTDRFLSGGGLADVSVTVMNQSFSLPFSKLNKYLSMCGDICVAFSLIAAARILSSAV